MAEQRTANDAHVLRRQRKALDGTRKLPAKHDEDRVLVMPVPVPCAGWNARGSVPVSCEVRQDPAMKSLQLPSAHCNDAVRQRKASESFIAARCQTRCGSASPACRTIPSATAFHVLGIPKASLPQRSHRLHRPARTEAPPNSQTQKHPETFPVSIGQARRQCRKARKPRDSFKKRSPSVPRRTRVSDGKAVAHPCRRIDSWCTAAKRPSVAHHGV
jgi:hypothetical protein